MIEAAARATEVFSEDALEAYAKADAQLAWELSSEAGKEFRRWIEAFEHLVQEEYLYNSRSELSDSPGFHWIEGAD